MTTTRPFRNAVPMTAPAPTPGGYTTPEMHDALRRLCAAADLDPAGFTLMRGQTNAVVRLASAPVVVKIARRGTSHDRVRQTIDLVQWLTARNFPTVPLHPVEQPIAIDQYIGTFYTYLPQPQAPVPTVDLAHPLRELHAAGLPPTPLPGLDAVAAIRHSLSAATTLPTRDHRFLTQRINQLASDLAALRYDLRPAVLHGDPQHGNALHGTSRALLCDWDSAVLGQPEWDLVTIEVHTRRFGHGRDSYDAFAEAYGYDITSWSGYRTLRDLRELRMISTNARKSANDPDKMSEVIRRINGLREQDAKLAWHIM